MGHDIANSYHIVGNFICFQFFPIKIMQQWIPKYLSLCSDPWFLLGRNLQKFNCLALTMAIFQILTKKHFRKLVQYVYSTPEYQSGHFAVSSSCLNPVILKASPSWVMENDTLFYCDFFNFTEVWYFPLLHFLLWFDCSYMTFDLSVIMFNYKSHKEKVNKHCLHIVFRLQDSNSDTHPLTHLEHIWMNLI